MPFFYDSFYFCLFNFFNFFYFVYTHVVGFQLRIIWISFPCRSSFPNILRSTSSYFIECRCAFYEILVKFTSFSRTDSIMEMKMIFLVPVFWTMLKFTFYILGLLMVRHLFIRILIINLDMCLIKLIFVNEIRFNFHSFFFVLMQYFAVVILIYNFSNLISPLIS